MGPAKLRRRAGPAHESRTAPSPEVDSETTAPALAQKEDIPLDQQLHDLGFTSEGLSLSEAEVRLTRYGPNEIPEKRVNPLVRLLTYFWGPIPAMIEVAAILSAVLKHCADLGVILALLIMNALVGFREEYEAGNAVAALKQQLASDTSVKRDGRWRTLPPRELVPGDTCA